MIIMNEFLFSICFISLSTHLKLYIDIFIMSKLIKHAMVSWHVTFFFISCFGKRGNKIWARVGPVIVISCRTRAGLGPECLGPGPG